MSSTDLAATSKSGVGRHLLLLLPLIAFFGLVVLFMVRLGAGDPARIPSVMLGRPVPTFALAALPGRAKDTGGLTDADLRSGHVTLVNVFASWCVECHEEHARLIDLARDPRLLSQGIELDGIVYKDNADDARRYLGQKGDPYARIGNDTSGRTGIDFGVYGVPETFVVKGDGTIAYKLIGPVTADNEADLLAEIDKAALP